MNHPPCWTRVAKPIWVGVGPLVRDVVQPLGPEALRRETLIDGCPVNYRHNPVFHC